MVGTSSMEWKTLPFLRSRTKTRKRTIVVGMKSDSFSRDVLLRLINAVAMPGDNVLAIHVQAQPNHDAFDPNSFHIHEDLCKSKQVDLLVKVCTGKSYILKLGEQVRLNFATILALGCSVSGPSEAIVNGWLKELPPTCCLLLMNSTGRVILQRQGTSQQGSTFTSFPSSPFQSQTSKVAACRLKSLGLNKHTVVTYNINRTVEDADYLGNQLFHRFVHLESKVPCREFTLQELQAATNNFSPGLLIGQGGHSKVYRARLQDGRAAAVKVLKGTHSSEEDLSREVNILSAVKHENIVQIIGYCRSKDVLAIVSNLLMGNLKQNLKQLKWSKRMQVAIGVAKSLEYLHNSFNPPVVHRDVKSSNILLSKDCYPQLSDFGAATVLYQSDQIPPPTNPYRVVGTFGYLAPEYMMHGQVDEKVDVYSYGVVLLELITGKRALQQNLTDRISLVPRARSLLSSGQWDRLIDPLLNEDYRNEEMEIMMLAAHLCLMQSSSKRPTIKMVLRLFEEPKYWLKMQREGYELLNGFSSNRHGSS